jgi:hypothetical protein
MRRNGTFLYGLLGYMYDRLLQVAMLLQQVPRCDRIIVTKPLDDLRIRPFQIIRDHLALLHVLLKSLQITK